MSSRFGRFFTLVGACTLLVACAEGAPSSAPDVQRADPLLAIPPTVCGDNMREGAEMCDCPEATTTMCAAPEGTSCESLGMGTGSVYCDANTCTFITMLCSMGQGNTGGTGGGAGAGS